MSILDAFSAWSPELLAFAFGAMFVAGFAKGVVGFALPLIALSAIGSVLSPATAVACLIAPTFASNIWQTFRQGLGAAWDTLRRFWRLNLFLFVMIGLSAQLLVTLSDRTLFLILGTFITVLGGLMLIGWRPPKPSKRREGLVESGVGVVSGFFGGLGGIWGPPLVLYLTVLELDRRDIIRAQGVSFLIGSVILVAAHLRSGLLLGPEGVLSLAMIVPAMAGMALGLAVQDRLNPPMFRKITLAVLVIAGLNLLRRGLFA